MSTSDMARLAALADQQYETEMTIAALEADIQAARARLKELSEFEIPDLMDELGITEFTTASGTTISVKEAIRCGNLSNPDGLAWLRENQQGGMIKSEVTVPFPKGGDEAARRLVLFLKANGFGGGKATQHVHNGTLRAAIRTMLEDGEDVPLKLLGAYIQRTAKVIK